MKRWMLWGAALLTAAACNTVELSSGSSPSLFDIDAPGELFGPLAQEITYEVDCDRSWSVRLKDGSWATVGRRTEMSQTRMSLKLALTLNLGEEERIDSLLFTSGNIVKRVAVKQSGISAFVSSRTIDLSAGQQTLTITAPDDWTFTVPASASWISLSAESGKAGITVMTLKATDANENVGARSAQLTLSCAGAQIPIQVTQAQTDAIRTVGELWEFDYNGGTFQVDVLSNVDVEVDIPDEAASWLTLLESKALDNSTLTFLAAPNRAFQPVSATVTLRGGSVERSFSVTVGGFARVMEESSLGVFDLTPGTDWTYSEGIDQISRHYGKGTATFSLRNPYEKAYWSLTGSFSDPGATTVDAVLSYLLSADGEPASQTLSLKVLHRSGNLVWLQGDGTPGFIIKL